MRSLHEVHLTWTGGGMKDAFSAYEVHPSELVCERFVASLATEEHEKIAGEF